jgi:hypothetical protein
MIPNVGTVAPRSADPRYSDVPKRCRSVASFCACRVARNADYLRTSWGLGQRQTGSEAERSTPTRARSAGDPCRFGGPNIEVFDKIRAGRPRTPWPGRYRRQERARARDSFPSITSSLSPGCVCPVVCLRCPRGWDRLPGRIRRSGLTRNRRLFPQNSSRQRMSHPRRFR